MLCLRSNSVDWINILKVFVFFYQNTIENDLVITQEELAQRLNINSSRAVAKAIKAIRNCNIEPISIDMYPLKRKNNAKEWRTLGTIVKIDYDFK